jgi:peptidoglycan-N-acetylglucosamine deacetylase
MAAGPSGRSAVGATSWRRRAGRARRLLEDTPVAVGWSRRAAGVRRRIDDPGTVALTFDDGPDQVWTPRVLDLLARHQATATFFLLGRQVAAHPDLVGQILDDGHAVGSHSWSHPHPGGRTWRELAEDYGRGRAEVEAAVGREVALFRPPHGLVNSAVALAVRRVGLRPWIWTIDTRDWAAESDPEMIVETASGAVAGDVLLWHDGLVATKPTDPRDRSASLAALETVLGELSSRGLRFGPLAAPPGPSPALSSTPPGPNPALSSTPPGPYPALSSTPPGPNPALSSTPPGPNPALSSTPWTDGDEPDR